MHLPQYKVLTQLAYSVLENFRGLEFPRTRTRTRTWKLVLGDPRGQGLSSRTTILAPAAYLSILANWSCTALNTAEAQMLYNLTIVKSYQSINQSIHLYFRREPIETATQKTIKKSKSRKSKSITHIKRKHTKCCTMLLPHTWTWRWKSLLHLSTRLSNLSRFNSVNIAVTL